MCYLAPRAGFEPATYRLTAGRSTVELSGKVPNIVASGAELEQSADDVPLRPRDYAAGDPRAAVAVRIGPLIVRVGVDDQRRPVRAKQRVRPAAQRDPIGRDGKTPGSVRA